MRQYVSDNSITSPPKLTINTETLPSIPPGCEKYKVAGIFTLRIQSNYLDTLRQSTALRCKFWGMEGEGVMFQSLSLTEQSLNLNIRNSIENVTKYFQDMKVFCIEVMNVNLKQRGGSIQRKKTANEYKQIGWIFVNPQRYIISNIINSFEETVNIIDMKKQKIGEAKASIFINMHKVQPLYLNPTQQYIKRPSSIIQIEDNKHIQLPNIHHKIIPSKDPSSYREQIYEMEENKHQISLDDNPKYSFGNIQSRKGTTKQKKEDDLWIPEAKRKSRAQQFLEQYFKNKPQHTELSIIRHKYGLNNPSVEILKLKYDEAKLLLDHQQDNIKEQSRIHLLLKSIKAQQKIKIQYLTIYCEEKDSKLKTQTKLIFSQPINQQKIQINHLYMLPNLTNILTFEIKDGKIQIEANSLAKIHEIQLKNKNGKKIATLQFKIISNRILEGRSSPTIQQKFDNNEKGKRIHGQPQRQIDLPKEHHQIKKQPDHFMDILFKQEQKFVQILKILQTFLGKLGLSKLISNNSEQPIERSIASNFDQNERRQTEHNHQGLKIKTEQSKEPNQKQIQRGQRNIKTQQSKQAYQGQIQTIERHEKEQNEALKHHEKEHDDQENVSFKKIVIVLNKIQISSKESIEDILIWSDVQKISLKEDQLILPKAIVLTQNTIYNIEVKANEQLCQGVFIATPQPQKIKLYHQKQEAGILYLFSQKKQATQQSQIAFKLVTTHKAGELQDEIFNIQKQYEDDSSLINYAHTIAKSPHIKMIIRSIRPTRSTFRFKVKGLTDEKPHFINFPNQNEIILSNSQQGWKINLIGQEFEQIIIPNYLTSNTYCFTHSNDKSVGYSAIIQIQQCWDPDSLLSPQQSLNIFAHIEQIISIKQFEPTIYDLILQNESNLTQIGSIKPNPESKKVSAAVSFVLKQTAQSFTVRLIKNQSKELIAEFKFAIRMIAEGIRRCERYLISSQPGYRLKLTVFQLRHEWNYCKPNRILSLFGSPNKKTIESWVNSTSNIGEEDLIAWLKTIFGLALGEIDIILCELIKSKTDSSWKEFLKLFKSNTYQILKDSNEVEQQFRIFDLNEQGLIGESQMSLVKRILERNFKQVSSQLQKLYTTYSTSSEKQDNFIIDISQQLPSHFDYLSFLSLFTNDFQLKPKKKEKPSDEINKKQSQYLSVKILSFSKLSINGAPCTLLFKTNGFALAQPIHRCYSFTYNSSEQVAIPNKQPLELQIYCQKLNRQGHWQYRLIQKVPLAPQIKILGGTIFLQIKPVDQSIATNKLKFYQNQQNKSNFEQSLLNLRHELKDEQQKVDLSEFSKSFWNKSLNQTRKKWTKANLNVGGLKQKSKLHEIDQEQIRKKMSIFNKQWQD